MASHSTVTYVEPNMSVGYGSKNNKDYDDVGWRMDDMYERAPRLEDYCIAMNIEVEISSRDSQGSIKDGNKDVLILQWSGKDKNSVNFMSGTRIGGYDINGTDKTNRLTAPLNLTTYYADMYVGDLVNYGTTEMIGIKSVDIQYEKSCVPIITVQFTDVRGLSLFQPTELSRDNTYNGIKGLSKDNVAQSFFQCFFKMPLPKFTIFIKGFYGRPVAYVCMCDKFDTNFNSDTGDFDVTARFIGYTYSFMTDISFDALLAAPYSDFFGKKYWDDNVKNGRFFLEDKLKTHKMPMPTLYEVHRNFKELVKSSDEEMESTTLTEEEKTHEKEIAALTDIRSKFSQWYQELFIVMKEKYGKRYVFDFMEQTDEDADWYRILLLANSTGVTDPDLSVEYKQFPDEFKKRNDNLYAAIEEFNKSGASYKKLKNISRDFSEYTRINIFNDCYVNKNTRKIEFGGFHPDNKLNRVQVVNRLFHDNEADSGSKDAYKEYTLSSIYNDGTHQYKFGYAIEVDYGDIKRRINALIADANRSSDEREKEKARKEHNRIMMSKMNWYPSIENFTKIMMAHLETFMMMMYNVAEACSARRPEDVGVTVGKNGDACDVPENSKILPPFPRVTKQEVGEDNITKTVDSWVGDYDNGKGFIEADMINGLFNAVEYIQQLVKEEKELEQRDTTEPVKPKPIVKHPLTSYDFHLTKNPYGTETDVANNPNAFAGKIAMRMFNILAINNFKKQYSDKFANGNGDFLKKLGTIEAENFNDVVTITNESFLKMLGAKGDSGTITPQAIIQCVKNDLGIGGNNELPWRKSKTDEGLFDISFWLSRYSTSYSKSQKTYIYPMQSMSFDTLDDSLKIFNKGANSIQTNNNDIIVNWIEGSANAMKLLGSNNPSCFGSVFISDDYKTVENGLDVANSSPDNLYKDIYDLLHDDSVFNAEKFSQMIFGSGVFRPKLGITTVNKHCVYKIAANTDGLPIRRNRDTKEMQCNDGEALSYVFDREKIGNYTSEIENGNITSWFLTECRGFDILNEKYVRSQNKSLFVQHNYQGEIDKAVWGFGSGADKRAGFFLMGLEAVDYAVVAKYLNSNSTYTYVPKLAVLQMGAALASMNGINDTITEDSLLKRIVLPRTFTYIIPYLNSINTLTRIAYIKYFKDWVFKYISDINKYLVSDKKIPYNSTAIVYEIDTLKRALFREDSSFITSMSNNVMTAVLITKGNVNHFKNVTSSGLLFDEYAATNFLDGFLSRLREIYGIDKEDKGGDAVKLAKSSSKTTNDMKKELYRYLKLVYDRWIPSTEKKSWLYETYFLDLSGDTSISDGHLFHFIDSFYNKIGDKLLINPKLMSDRINSALESTDVNVMMLGFMSDIYNQNKCMLMCLQNFMDLGDSDSMNMMFRPIPYNSMGKPHKHPDFVVVYPYEPSKYLNVDNGEFNNDGFMLNDEFDTPLAIKSRGGNDGSYYQIPAFGVAYGKQYQSYFKKVSVGMASPIVTEQVIRAKHAILRASQDSATKTVAAQDMYDIYASQSYTCKVDMMGCAWVQPLMYFVLNNVPMFRGSYMIMKVTHKITPGNMTTEFVGCRMANVSNRLVDEIFTDEDVDIRTMPYLEVSKERNADVDNDCPYKVFPIFDETDNVNITGDAQKDGLLIMQKLENLGYNKYAAAGIVGNMYVESYDYFKGGTGKHFRYDLVVKDSGTSGGLCMWHNGNLIDLVEGKTKGLGHNPTHITYSESVREEYSKKLRKLGLDAQLTYLKNTMDADKSKGNYVPLEFNKYNKMAEDAKSASVAAQKFRALYERSADKTAKQREVNQKRYDAADDFYKLATGQSSQKKTSEPDKSVEKDIFKGLFNAVQKSINSTNKACELSMRMYIKKSEFSDGIMEITQADGNNDKLPLVFDILLNGYYDYLQKLWWVSPSEDFKVNPSKIYVTAMQSPRIEQKYVLVSVRDKLYESVNIKFGADSTSVNPSLLKSVYKKYRGVNKEIPQFDNAEIFKNITIQGCNTVSKSPNYKISEATTITEGGMIDNWDANKAANWLICASTSKSQHICAFAVQQAIIAGGINCPSGDGYRKPLNLEKTGKWKFIATGTTTSAEIKGFTPQVGDVIGMTKGTKYNEYGHVCMYCGSKYGWISDYKQYNAPYPYSDKHGVAKYWVVRYAGGDKKISQKPQYCLQTRNGLKCLNKPC